MNTAVNQPLLLKAPAAALRAAIILDFITGGYGKAYGVSACQRAWLVSRFFRIMRAVRAGTTAITYLILGREILSLPHQVVGDVVECGVWKGAGTACLSLVCQLVGRRLVACDSFQGLPGEGLQLYLAPHRRVYGYLKGGMFEGSLAEVQANVKQWGRLAACDFVPGFFAESLKALTRPVALAFLDVDLPSSFRECLAAVWPLLAANGVIYADDIGCMGVVQVFFDDVWWLEHLGCPAPGLVGSGCGIPGYANIGYSRKAPPFDPALWQKDPDLYYPADY